MAGSVQFRPVAARNSLRVRFGLLMDQGLKLVLLTGHLAGFATGAMVLRTHVADAAALLEELLNHAHL